ncbi:endoglucanase 14 [Amborella trichopoda]|nr:endoglucanase 14 [Amborella trichopoda]|eukprot:XP_020522306.1 endoglucanase 14 [Amborella trichopoda]
MQSHIIILCLWLVVSPLGRGDAAPDYGLALSKAIVYYEAQRSGKLPPSQRAQWRSDSALADGKLSGIDLTGGYYDAGDNVKFGFPMAFTVTMLAWSTIQFWQQLSQHKELGNAMSAIRWGTDYFIKAHPQPDVLYGQVGEGATDHICWQRPEDMTTPRPAFKVDDSHPGSDLAGETAAAMAAASVVFQQADPRYSALLLGHAKQLFEFGRNHLGYYHDSIPDAKTFYESSLYEDDLLWGAAWLYEATGYEMYLDYLSKAGSTGGIRKSLAWDDKFPGVQALVSKLLLQGKIGGQGIWGQYQSNLEELLCNYLQKGNFNLPRTPAGMLWFQPFDNLQDVVSSSFLLTVYSDYLATATGGPKMLSCHAGQVQPQELFSFARSQVDYILGNNPMYTSYMVGFGPKFPGKVHHRGASIVSVKKDPTPVGCQQGFVDWFNRDAPNPNVIDGAIVGGPDENDWYDDTRNSAPHAEASSYNTAPLVGVLAKLASM